MSDAIRSGLAQLLGTSISTATPQRIGGGCIDLQGCREWRCGRTQSPANECYRYESSDGTVFVKVAPAPSLDMFEAEVAGLNELRNANAVRVPQVLAVGAVNDVALLALEWLELARSSSSTDAKLGEQLAAQHRVTKPLFGFKRGNYIGATPQINYWSRSWLHFWREHRLEAQLNLAETKGADAQFIERAILLCTLMDGMLGSYTPIASLLHGDLWSDNAAVDASGEPVIYDPAVYYGDRECDLAMTRLFGGFSQDFYAAYESAWPLNDGWRPRTELYNLYHVLNHFNLFGGSYLAQAEAMVDGLLAQLGY